MVWKHGDGHQQGDELDTQHNNNIYKNFHLMRDRTQAENAEQAKSKDVTPVPRSSRKLSFNKS